jgi:hypothetical protein
MNEGEDYAPWVARLVSAMKISGNDKLGLLTEGEGMGFRHSLYHRATFTADLTWVNREREDAIIKNAIAATLVNGAWPWMSYNDCANLILNNSEQGREVVDNLGLELPPEGAESLTWCLLNPACQENVRRAVRRGDLLAVRTESVLGEQERGIQHVPKVTVCFEKLIVGWRVHTWRWNWKRFNDQISRIGEEDFAQHKTVKLV